LIYVDETWPLKVQHEVKLDRNEWSMINCMCEFTLKEKKKTQVREFLGLEPVKLGD